VDGGEKEVMPTQIALRFDEVPITCPAQKRYHIIEPCLAGRCAPVDIARQLDISYATVTRWLCEFRDKGLPGLFPATQYPREPYTPEKIIVTLVAYKCFAQSDSCPIVLPRCVRRGRSP
jgi:Homeodomain-like domain